MFNPIRLAVGILKIYLSYPEFDAGPSFRL